MLRTSPQLRQCGLQSVLNHTTGWLEAAITTPDARAAAGRAPQLYIASRRPWWLWSGEADFPLSVPHAALQACTTLKPAVARWMLDAGTLADLSTHGRLVTSTREYV